MRLSTIFLACVGLALWLGAGTAPPAVEAQPGEAGGEAEARADLQAEAQPDAAARRPWPSPPSPSLSPESLGEAAGQVQPSRHVTLRSPLNELLESVEVVESERVRGGQILARLDSREQVLAVEAARLEAESETQARRARLALEEAELTLEIVESIEAVGAHEVRRTRLQKHQAEADHDLAQERAEQARLQYERQKARLERYTIEAPFDGTVHRIEAAPGALLNSDQPILSLVALDPLHAVVYMPFERFGQLDVGGEYALQASAPVNRTLVGRLITIDPVLDFPSRQFRCVFEIANPDSSLPAGFRVNVLGPAEGEGLADDAVEDS